MDGEIRGQRGGETVGERRATVVPSGDPPSIILCPVHHRRLPGALGPGCVRPRRGVHGRPHLLLGLLGQLGLPLPGMGHRLSLLGEFLPDTLKLLPDLLGGYQ